MGITGGVAGLYPGADATLRMEVINPHDFAIRVASVAVTVHSAPDCAASLLRVDTAVRDVDIPQSRTGIVPLDVHLDRRAPDACQGVTFPLTFTATATDASGEAGQQPGSVGPPRPGGTPGENIAVTGVDIQQLLVVALGLVGAGLVALRVSRRRTR